MLTVAALCGATATVCWPLRPAARQLTVRRAVPDWVLRARPAPFVVAGCVLLAVWAGIAAGAAAALAAVVGVRRWRAARSGRLRASATRRLADGVHAMVGELDRGAHPALAAATVAEHGHPAVSGVFAAIASSARLGAPVADCLTAQARHLPHLGGELDRIASAWRLAVGHGVPLAGLLTAIHRDLDHRARFAARLRAQLAGARASGVVLAFLPLAGVGIGELIGAGPLGVLFSGGAGGALLLAGTALICGGLCWTARITERITP